MQVTMASLHAEQTPLAGWHVLVTRPRGVAHALIQRITETGAQVTHVPLLVIDALPETDADRALAQNLDRFDCVIVTSRHAVKHAMPRLAAYWPQWPAAQPWLAVGAATAAALTRWGIRASAPADARSEGLLAMPELTDIRGKQILLLTGEGGRGLLDAVLTARGAQLTRYDTYRRRPCVDGDEGLQRFCAKDNMRHVVLVNSADALHTLLARAPAVCSLNIDCVVPSERLATLARNAGFSNPQRAASANDTDMLATLIALAQR